MEENESALFDAFKSVIGIFTTGQETVSQESQVPTLDKVLDLESIKIEELPRIIHEQVTSIVDLDGKIRTAIKKAESAKNSAYTAKEQTNDMSFWGGRRDAINALQNAGFKLSEAVCSNTEALELAFKSLQKLAEATKYLFVLGVSNIAMNRMVVRELELKLKGASAEKLSDLARQEVLNVVIQLKAQEDILVKQDKLGKKVRVHDDQLQIQVAADVRHAELLRLGDERDKQQDEWLQSQSEKDLQHDEDIRKLESKYKEIEVAFIALKDEQRDLHERLQQTSERAAEMRATIERLSGSRKWIPLGLSLAALIGTTILFILRFI